MDLQRSLISKLIEEDGLNRVTRSGIDESFFDDVDCKQVYTYVKRHYAEYKKVPSRAAIRQVFPNFSFVDHDEPLDFFINQIKEGYRRGVLEEALLEINRVYAADTQEAEAKIREVLGHLSVTQKSFKDLNLVESAEERIKSYEERKESGASGILSNWTKIDYETLGCHPEEFIVLVGVKYLGKSWLMLWLAYQAMLQGERVLFATKEMSAEDMADRFDSIYAGVSYDSLRRGELSGPEEDRYRASLGDIGGRRGIGSVTLARHSVATIDDIASKAVEVDATIIFIDSVYLFDASTQYSGSRNGSEVQRRMAISQRSKRLAQELGIPVICSTQAGRRKTAVSEPGLDNIEWSNAFSQDADVVIEITRDEIDRELNQAWVHLLKCRKGQETKTCVNMDFQYMKFTERLDVTKEPTYDVVDDKEESGDQLWS